ncbi:TetR family transcriptional regulator [Pilimelia terevasa]|uniref:TetR family transcriptional regulator n=1 Tax=Pilimelia terevasa TaxID=53372 RepID=A0A8J3BHH6_9ACTN|nr:TetR/AcrR family transcriptional regulator [Pilimelia terevasa]GGK15255.1 TetR family transcriptional regulator [Pilimelia terevasa]
MASPDTSRAARLGDAAIEVIAARGLRGLTHRAVDAAAGLPAGSTSYYARTRLALLELVCDRLVALDSAEAGLADGRPLPADLDAVVALGAGFAHHALHAGRSRMLARWELAMEATRNPALRERYNAAGARFRAPIAAVLAALGSPAPRRHGGIVLHWMEGVVFDAIVGAGSAAPPDLPKLRAGFRELLVCLLGGPGARRPD